MTLIEMPGNRGQIFAIDPYHVTGVNGFKGTLPGRGGQLFDMTTVWIDNRSIFVCSWKVEHVLQVLNAARQPLAKAFEAGYRAAELTQPGALRAVPEEVQGAFDAWIKKGGKK